MEVYDRRSNFPARAGVHRVPERLSQVLSAASHFQAPGHLLPAGCFRTWLARALNRSPLSRGDRGSHASGISDASRMGSRGDARHHAASDRPATICRHPTRREQRAIWGVIGWVDETSVRQEGRSDSRGFNGSTAAPAARPTTASLRFIWPSVAARSWTMLDSDFVPAGKDLGTRTGSVCRQGSHPLTRLFNRPQVGHRPGADSSGPWPTASASTGSPSTNGMAPSPRSWTSWRRWVCFMSVRCPNTCPVSLPSRSTIPCKRSFQPKRADSAVIRGKPFRGKKWRKIKLHRKDPAAPGVGGQGRSGLSLPRRQPNTSQLLA